MFLYRKRFVQPIINRFYFLILFLSFFSSAYFFFPSIYFFLTNFTTKFFIFSPLFAIIFIFFIPEKKVSAVRFFALISSLLTFFLSVLSYVEWTRTSYKISFLGEPFSDYVYHQNIFMNIHYTISIDGLSLWFVILTAFLFPLVILVSWESIHYQPRLYYMMLFLIEFCLLNLFCCNELFLFYFFFESAAIPMFIMIGIWGSTMRRVYASFKFFLYTIAGSILMFLALVYIYSEIGTTDYEVLLSCRFSLMAQFFLFLAFFSSFAIKIPMMPFHLWLPEAHVEAPTGISVLLAGILLKTGGYGFIKFVLPLCTEVVQLFAPLVYILSIISIVYGSLVALVQTDLKKIVAYSSVAHMNMVTLAIFSGSIAGLEGAIYLMLTHGVISSALFICVGVLYDRYHTRIVRYYGGLTSFMPLFSFLFLVFTLSNLSFPGTGSFVGEFIILSDLFFKNTLLSILAGLGVILGAFYSVWLYNRVMFGPVDVSTINYYSDANRREIAILAILLFTNLFMGIYPYPFFKCIEDVLINLQDIYIWKNVF